jgi:2-keto-4-pentenoate hydratase
MKINTTIPPIFEIRSAKLYSLKESFDKISVKQAYKIQNDIIKSADVGVVGWKLGGVNFKTRDLFSVDELYWGPIFDTCILNNPSELMLYCGEVEVALKFNSNIENLQHNISPDDLNEYIQSAALSIEYPHSIFPNVVALGVSALISDCCGSGQCLLGKEIPFDQFSEDVNIKVNIDTVDVEMCSTDILIDGLYQTVCDFINKSLEFGLELKGGQWVFTGGLSECRPYEVNSFVRIESNILPSISYGVV